jgi:chromosome segregation ATPase
LEAQDTLGQEQTQFEEERVRLESMVESEKTKLKQLEQRWKRDQQQFKATKEDLEMKIVFEKKRVEELSTKLEQEMERFNQEKATLEDRLDEERTRLMEVQAQLAEEQLLFQEEKADLEYKLSEEIRIGLLKKRQMNNRFESIRKELTALWQGAKREARVERERLTKKYEEQLEAMALNVQSLEQDLERATKSSGDMRAQVQSVEASKIRLQQEYNDMELRYRTTLAQRNLEISDLQATVSDLRSNLQVREAILERYETSFREIAKLGWNLGKKRAKKAAKRVRGWVSLKRDNI